MAVVSTQGPTGAGIVPAAVSGALGGRRAQRTAKKFHGKENRTSLHYSTSVMSCFIETISTVFAAKNQKQIPRCARNDSSPRSCQAMAQRCCGCPRGKYVGDEES